jgi:serine/threonine protein kinase
MPPEYLQGMVTPMSDIFSLGVIIMEVITGHRKYLDDIGTPSTVFIELVRQLTFKIEASYPRHHVTFYQYQPF